MQFLCGHEFSNQQGKYLQGKLLDHVEIYIQNFFFFFFHLACGILVPHQGLNAGHGSEA